MQHSWMWIIFCDAMNGWLLYLARKRTIVSDILSSVSSGPHSYILESLCIPGIMIQVAGLPCDEASTILYQLYTYARMELAVDMSMPAAFGKKEWPVLVIGMRFM